MKIELEEAPEAQTPLASPLSPFPSLSSRAWLAKGRAEAQEQLEGGGWDSTKGRGPRPKEGGNLALPQQFPTEFTAQKTPLLQQLHVEVNPVLGPKGQAGERGRGSEDNSRLIGGRWQKRPPIHGRRRWGD